MPRALQLLCAVGLGDAQVAHHLAPLTLVERVSKIWLVRHAPLRTQLPKVHTLVVDANKPRRFWAIDRACRRIAREQALSAVVSFNPFPYGLLAHYATRSLDLPVHYGFIGSDWYRRPDVTRRLLPIIRRGSLVTATGAEMQRAMVDAGLAASQIEVLPHSIELERFPVADPTQATYDAVFVGALIDVKRVDTLVDGWAKVVVERPGATLCIVGDGPRRASLEVRARALGVMENIDFVGYQQDVAPWLQRARLFLMASASEGLPFALIEAMATGLVPVVTNVGTIGDLVVPGRNGAFFTVGDDAGLAEQVLALLRAPDRCDALRSAALKVREDHGHDRVAAQWARWLDRVAP